MSFKSSVQEEDQLVDSNATDCVSNACPEYCKTITIRDANGSLKRFIFPKALDLDRPKRARTTFSSQQLDLLESEFKTNQYLVGKERTDLARRLGLSETQVKVWFQNRRTKFKKDKEKHSQNTNSVAESLATKSVLRLLEYKTPPNINSAATSIPASSSEDSRRNYYTDSYPTQWNSHNIMQVNAPSYANQSPAYANETPYRPRPESAGSMATCCSKQSYQCKPNVFPSSHTDVSFLTNSSMGCKTTCLTHIADNESVGLMFGKPNSNNRYPVRVFQAHVPSQPAYQRGMTDFNFRGFRY